MSDIRGIVLAAGEARRMPYKALLPTKKGVLIESALGLCKATCRSTHIVLANDIQSQVIQNALLMLRPTTDFFTLVRQQIQLGPCHAVWTAINDMGTDLTDHALIVFCDNVYSRDDADEIAKVRNHTQTIVSTRAIASAQLDAYARTTNRWMERAEPGAIEHEKFAGWLLLHRSDTKYLTAFDSFVPFFNKIHAVPCPMKRGVWHDLGTPESYLEYLKWQTSQS